jgi:hypothetical protein
MEANLCTGLGGCTCNAASLTLPVYSYALYVGGTCAVVGGHVYRGCAIPDLRGTYFFSDNCSNNVWSFRYSPMTGVTQFTDRTSQLNSGAGGIISSVGGFGEDGHGELYIACLTGQVFKNVPLTPSTLGVSTYGAGTPGCSGPHVISASCPPTLFNPGFRITCTNAPPNATGLLGISTGQDLAGSDPLGIGILVHIGVVSPNTFLLFNMTSDSTGTGSLITPIPNNPALVSMNFYAQSFWAWPGAACLPSPMGISSSNGLRVTIQP